MHSSLGMKPIDWILCGALSTMFFAATSNHGLVAQEDHTTGPTESSLAIEEVVVTAQRREQSIQDVGLSITALSGNELEQLRVEIPSDLASHIPNLDMTSQLGSQNVVVTIRGIGLNDFSANLSPSVGVYLDEVFLASPAMVSFSVFDLERVEVLKGPQGTLYGRNTTGGAINFITKKPGDEVEGYLRGTYGNFDRIEGEGAVTLPMGDSVSARIAGKIENRNSFFTNISTGRLSDIERYALRGTLKADISSNFEATLSVQYGRDDSSNMLLNHVGVLGENCDAFETGIPDPANCVDVLGFSDLTEDRFVGDIGDIRDPFVDIDTISGSLDLNWRIRDNITLTSVTGYQYFDRIVANETDANPFRLLSDVRDDEIEQISQELRLAGVSGPLDWIVGGFYSKDTVDSRNDFDFVDFLGFQAFNTVDQDTESIAGFVDGRLQLSDRFTIVGGARLTYEKRDFMGATSILGGPIVSSADDSIDETDISGRIGLEFTPNENSLYYATFSNAFHSGGFFGSLAFNPAQYEPFKEEDIFAIEVGGKWTSSSGRFQVNASGFYYIYKDIQTTVGVDFGSALTNIDGTTNVFGLDLDFAAYPIPGLQLRGALGILETELPAFVGTILGPIPEGNELPNAPNISATGLARYEFPIGIGNLLGALQVDFQFKDDTHREAQNLPIATADSFTEVNARASIFSEDERWELAIWGENLNNDAHAEFIVFIPFTQSSLESMAAPRTYGISLSYRF